MLSILTYAFAPDDEGRREVPRGREWHQRHIQTRLQPLLDDLALRYNTSFSFGFHDQSARVALAAGVSDRLSGKRMAPTSLVPMGSVTKSWTAAGIVQLAEKGVLSLDDPAHVHVDPFLKQSNGSTLLEVRAARRK
jgi:CubicO group peptidase (beta-lactamase class C family)